MKNQLKNFSICLALGMLFLFPLQLFAGNKKVTIQSNNNSGEITPEKENEVDLDEMNFLDLLNSVPIPDENSAGTIRKFQNKIGRQKLFDVFNSKNGCVVETIRKNEVLLVTIPASELFAPNDTVLRPTASKLLQPFKMFLNEPDTYRVLMVMHTDNTGSETYRDRLTESRANAIFDWFNDQGLDTSFLFPFAFGDDMPIVENTSMNNRAKNRRLEVYLVPGTKMIKQAKTGRIEF